MAILQDKTGERYVRLLVIGVHGRHSGGGVLYRCRCDCGKETIVRANRLNSGGTKSCGCYARDRSRTHGRRHSVEYASWLNMRNRCSNPNVPAFPDYGGRGITVCERWQHSFENFLADMGEMPKGHSIERRDNSLGYSPENCYWLPRSRQNKNRRSNHKVVVHNTEYCLTDACRVLNVSLGAVERRARRRNVSPPEVIDSIVQGNWRTSAPYKERRRY